MSPEAKITCRRCDWSIIADIPEPPLDRWGELGEENLPEVKEHLGNKPRRNPHNMYGIEFAKVRGGLWTYLGTAIAIWYKRDSVPNVVKDENGLLLPPLKDGPLSIGGFPSRSKSNCDLKDIDRRCIL